MAERKQLKCLQSECAEREYLDGLCQGHHEKSEKDRMLRGAARNLLFTSVVDGTLPTDPDILDEMKLLQSWWQKVCWAVNNGIYRDDMPKDEAEYAVHWCIQIAMSIVEDERIVRAGGSKPFSARAHYWTSFENLSKGLMSNGLPRSVGY